MVTVGWTIGSILWQELIPITEKILLICSAERGSMCWLESFM